MGGFDRIVFRFTYYSHYRKLDFAIFRILFMYMALDTTIAYLLTSGLMVIAGQHTQHTFY